MGWNKRIVLQLDCNPNPYKNPDCMRTVNATTLAPTQCVLGDRQDTFYNQLTWWRSTGQAGCQANDLQGCCCGPASKAGGCTKGKVPCPCCQLPQPMIAISQEIIDVCKQIVSNLTWHPEPY
jgi:hypothetical protein